MAAHRIAAIVTTAIVGGAAMLEVASRPAHAADARATAVQRAGPHPDLSGTYETGALGVPKLAPVQSSGGSVCLLCRPGETVEKVQAPPPIPDNPDQPVYKPEFRAKVLDLKVHQVRYDPALHCRNPGVPRLGPPRKIVQIKDEVVFLYADYTGDAYRIIPIDGRPHRADIPDSYMGDSVGRWDGDTLVIDVVNFNDDTWLADDGLYHSNELHVIERLHRVGPNVEYQATVDDPKLFAQPWVMKPRTLRPASEELIETPPCVERDLPNMTDESYHPNTR